jgi:Ras-related protein Rab-8A
VGVDFDRTMCKIGDKFIKLEVCDTAGQERFRAIPRQHYSKADGFILIFDVCNIKSFKDVESWIKDIINNTKGNLNSDNLSKSDISIFLIGNKIDNFEKREVNYKDAEDFAKLKGIKYNEISCKSGLNVYEVMTEIIMDSYINIRGNKSKSFNLLLKNNQKKKDKKNCC